MEHFLRVLITNALLEAEYELSRVTDKKDGRIILEIRRKEELCYSNLDSSINLDLEIGEDEGYKEKE